MTRISPNTTISGRKYVEAALNNCKQQRRLPNVPTLSITAVINTAVAGVDSTAASGSHRWNGHSGALIAKANMKPRNSALTTAEEAPSEPDDTAATIWRKSNVPGPCSAVTTYNPMTAASMIRPPNRLYNKNFTAARDRGAPPPKPPMRKYIGMSIASKNT